MNRTLARFDWPYAVTGSYPCANVRSSHRICPNRAAPEVTVRTRAPRASRRAGRSARVSWKCPRCVVENASSLPRPSSRRSGVKSIAALFTSMCSGRPEADQRAAKASTDDGSVRSRASTWMPGMSATAADARLTSREATVTSAPAAARARLVSRPRRLCPPVTTTFRPVRSTPSRTSAAVDAAVKPLGRGCWSVITSGAPSIRCGRRRQQGRPRRRCQGRRRR